MPLNDRQEEILKSLYQVGAVEVEELAHQWSVTTQTVRRDLAEICDSGLALRTHGGAKRLNTKSVVAYADRRLKHTLAKRCIAEAVSNLIPNGASLTLNIGTTTEIVAEALRFHNDLTVISNNINIVQIMRASRLKNLVLIGGEVRLADGAVIGEDAIKSISNFKTRKSTNAGLKVTLRKNKMYEFIDRLVNIALPRIKDFRGLSNEGFDKFGNYTFGVKEHIIFPEVNFDKVDKIRGLDISIVIKSISKEHSLELLKKFNFPFKPERSN